MKQFTTHSLLTIHQWLEKELIQKKQLQFIVPNPDSSTSAIGYKAWTNLAELHFCKILTPKIVSADTIELTFQKLNLNDSFHNDKVLDKREKYGRDSKFFTINKNSEPTFLLAYKRALESVKVATRKEVLNLGVNKADEFELIQELIDDTSFQKINFRGVDHSASTIEFAKERFPQQNFHFYQHDINLLDELKLPKSDLIISIGTFQTPEINYKPFLMSLVQNHLTPNGAFILGFPNARWIDGELVYGAKAPNYPYSEMSLLFNDVIFTKKYLQQKKFRVTITGREYIFITATKINI